MGVRRTVAIGLFALAALALAALAVAVIAGGTGTPERTAAAPLHPVAGNFEPDDTSLEDCSNTPCLLQAYGNIAYHSGPRRALTVLEEKVGSATNDCHRIAHHIGSASLARYEGDVGRTFAEGASTCASGYYHGVLSRALENVKSYRASALGAIARGLCSGEEVLALEELEYQCLHGLGHGLMITTGYNLPTSLEVCDHLRGKWKATSCNGGVFMENFFTSYGAESPWIRDDDPIYPCNEVAEQDKKTCYQLVTSRILRVIGVDWEKTAEICASVEKNWVASCFESFGRDVAGQTNRDPEEIREICAVARPYGGERECIRFAALDMVANDSTGLQAADLCDLTAGALRSACYEAVGSLMAGSRTTIAQSVADCRSLSTVAGNIAACTLGATERLAAPVER